MSRVRSAITRRAFLAGGLAAVSGTAGCSLLGRPHATGPRVSLTYWTPFAGGDGEAMRALVNRFNDEQAESRVQRRRFPFDEYYDNLSTALAAGTGPDVAVVHASELRRFADLLVPLDSALDSTTHEAYLPALWDHTTVDGRRLALPLDTHPNLLYYNRDVFESAGLDPTDPPTTFRRLRRCADRIATRTDSVAFNPEPYGDYYVREFDAWLAGRGGTLLDEARQRPTFDDADGRALARFYANVSGRWGWDRPDTSENRGTRAFRTGELAMTVNGTWFASVAESSGIDWATAAPFVAPGTDAGRTWTDDHLLCVGKRADRTERETAAAVAAIRQLTTDTELWATQAGHVPASRAAFDSRRVRESSTWRRSLGTAVRLFEADALTYLPRTSDNDRYRRPIDAALRDIYAHRVDPAVALTRAAAQVTSNLRPGAAAAG